MFFNAKNIKLLNVQKYKCSSMYKNMDIIQCTKTQNINVLQCSKTQNINII